MATLPPESHQARHIAESFGADAERYDRARPSYPQAMADAILAVTPGGSSGGRDVLDVGCGTGISAQPFLAAGCRVLGLDIDERMAEVARRGGLTVEVAKFEDWDSAGRQFDAVIAGQTWHWIDPVAGAGKAAQVLPRGGRLALFWNVFQPPAALAEAFAAVYRSVVPQFPFGWSRSPLDAYSAILARAAAGIRESGAFGEPAQWRFDWERPYTKDEWLDLVPTAGGHSHLPAGALAELLAGLGAAVDAAGGGFTMAYATVVVTASRA